MILKANKNGFFGFCEDCNEYHLHFNNLFFSFNRTNLVNFRRYLEEIDLKTSCIPEHDFVLKKNIVLKELDFKTLLWHQILSGTTVKLL